MSERKVLNKYYPPDFDPTKIPKLRGPRNKTFNIRIMAPFNMRCNTCGEYIYKGKKFNSRKETVENEDYLGLHIHRFYIKCPRCVAEIAFKTDPENTDYTLEAGATRNFEAAKTAMTLALQAQKEKEEEELNNPMKVLENRTKASRNEMERIENLEELREMNSRLAGVDHETVLKIHAEYEEQLKKLQEEEDEAVINQAFKQQRYKRLADSDDDSDSDSVPKKTKKDDETVTNTSVSNDNSGTQVDNDITQKSIATSVPKTVSTNVKHTFGIVAKPKTSSLKGLVVRKAKSKEDDSKIPTPSTSEVDAVVGSSKEASSENFSLPSNDEHSGNDPPERVSSSVPGNSGTVSESPSKQAGVVVKGALPLLGDYSESDESD